MGSILDRPPDQSGWGPAAGWWAPGGYLVTCHRCGVVFLGDKRAAHCWPCACKDELKPPAPKPVFVEAWIGWHLGSDGQPKPMICDHNPGHLAHVTRYRFQVPPDVLEHLTGTRECLMLDKFGNMQKDCREGEG